MWLESKTKTNLDAIVHYTGYDDPEDDRWYDEDQLRAMGRDTVKMLEQFDAEEDKKKLQGHIAPRDDGKGVLGAEIHPPPQAGDF